MIGIIAEIRTATDGYMKKLTIPLITMEVPASI